MGDRVILHSDINCCYASIEHLHHPELAGKPLAVGGDPEARHGIVLTADYIAKKYGVKTGMAVSFKSEALKKEIDNLLVSQNLYSKNYKIDEDWENLINKYLKCRKLNKELADAFVDKVQVFEDGRISVNLVYDDCLEELLQVKNKREGDLYE